ncbi:hypothetical protein RJ640_020845 [Escallonia rubra]|uniref:BRISC and BRCA1-A complex member 2 n=1 Tax=Escallonia rubra TaxID=112253 RepID=A0AA88UMD1_9ASTE|nr:hypothetical protein RJ640_020845 [Escallonia rubra]
MAVDRIPPVIGEQLNYLLNHSPLSIKVEQMWSGSKNTALLDRFTLAIPVCLDYIKSPDIIFGPEDEGFRPFHGVGEAGESRLPRNSLSDWSYKDPTRLLSLILELSLTRVNNFLLSDVRGLYLAHQRKRVAEVDDPRLTFEISTIFAREASFDLLNAETDGAVKAAGFDPRSGITDNIVPSCWVMAAGKDNQFDSPDFLGRFPGYLHLGIEMYMSSGTDKLEEVKFAVPLLDVDINKMVIGSSWRQQKIYLQVIFPVGRKYSTTPSPPRLKLVSFSELKALISIEDVRLPPWLNGMCMAEYLPILEEMLDSQIRDAVSSIEVRRKFIEVLALLFGRAVEADPVFCRKATFLAASGVFSFLVHFSLPIQFPRQPPVLMLQSSQHFNSQGAPLKSPLLQDYPWSPRWDASEMAERIFDFLAEECLSFKKYCNENMQQR